MANAALIDVTRRRLNRVLLRAANMMSPRVAASGAAAAPQDLGLEAETLALWERVKARTMTSLMRIDALRSSVEHVEKNAIEGDIVECGVWRGGSIMAAGLTLMRLGAARRRLWLYDTFEGMPPPSAVDRDFMGRSAADLLAGESPETSHIWARSSLEDVKAGMADTGYPAELVNYVVGPVESTLPGTIPKRIALLRIDTDWYSSTYHELVHLWPRLSPGGILIIDDFGHWAGAKKAVEQYFSEIGQSPFLHRIDQTGRLVIKANDRPVVEPREDI
jgi:O-methyltransferase